MSYTATVTEVQYQDPNFGTQGSDKYYRAYVMHDDDSGDTRVLFNWGRNGSRGQYQSVGAPTLESGTHAARGKLQTKLAKGYEPSSTRELRVVPDDLLREAGVSDNARSQAKQRLSVDPFARLGADTDRLIRMVTGPLDVQAEAITLKRDLDSQLAALKTSLVQAEGSLELASDVLSMKLGA